MKNIIGVLIFVIGFGALAQNQSFKKSKRFDPNFNIEQKVTIKSKKMALLLDLTQQQQKQVYNLLLKQKKQTEKFRKKHKANNTRNQHLTQNKRFNKINKGLDARIAFQKKIKNILNSEQYEAWKKGDRKRISNRMKKRKTSDRIGRF